MTDPLKVGTIEDGYKFVGGNPGEDKSWEPVDPKPGTVEDGYIFKGGDAGNEKNWAKERTWGEAFSDVVPIAKSGLINAAKILPFVVGAADEVISNAFGLGKPASGGMYDSSLGKVLNKLDKDQESQMSEGLQAKSEVASTKSEEFGKKFKDDLVINGFPLGQIAAELGNSFVQNISDPALLTKGIIQTIPSMLVSGGATRVAQSGAEKALPIIAKNLSEKAAARIAATTGVAAGVATGAVQQGIDVSTEVYDRAMSLPDEVWENNYDYSTLTNQMSPEEAKKQIATDLAKTSFVKNTLASLAINAVGAKLGGTSIERAFLKKPSGLVDDAAKSSIFKTGLKSGLGESGTEGLEEGYGARSTNEAIAYVDPTTDLNKGVGNAAGQGAATAFAMGSGAGVVNARAEGLISRQRAAAEKDQASQDLANATNADDAIDAAIKLSDVSTELESAVNDYLAPNPGHTNPLGRVDRQSAVQRQVDAENGLVDRTDNTGTQSSQSTIDTAINQANQTVSGAANPEDIAAQQRADANPEVTARDFADLTPMNPMQAKQRLAVLRSEAEADGRDPSNLVIALHPSQSGSLAIRALPGYTYSQDLQGNQREGQATDVNLPAPNSIESFVDIKRSENTPSARQFVKDYDAGRITGQDVESLILNSSPDARLANAAKQSTAQSPTQRIEAAAQEGAKERAKINVPPAVASLNKTESGLILPTKMLTASVDKASKLWERSAVSAGVPNWNDLPSWKQNLFAQEVNAGNVDFNSDNRLEAVKAVENIKSDPATQTALAPIENPANQNLPAIQNEPVEKSAPIAKVSQFYGVGSTSLSDGGKPFKTRDSAAKEKKLQPLMRVVKVKGGFALTEKTPLQLKAQEKAAERLRAGSVSGEPLSAHEFIASKGGLSYSEKSDLGVEKNVKIGSRWLFAGPGKGLSIEQATELLQEAGYIDDDSHQSAYNIIKESLSDPQYPMGVADEIAEKKLTDRVEAEYQDYLAAQKARLDDDPFGILDKSGFDTNGGAIDIYNQLDSSTQDEVIAAVSYLEENGYLDALLSEVNNENEQEQYDSALENIVEFFANEAKSEGDGGTSKNDRSRESGSTEEAATAEEGLTNPTKQDLEERLARLEQLEKDRQAESKAADQKAAADASVNDFALTGSDRTADIAASRGQKDIFGSATESESAPDQSKPVEKINDLGEKIGGARKDTALPSVRSRMPKQKDDRPTWARRFEVMQIVAGDGKGDWTLHDNRLKDRMGQPKQVGGRSNTYATEQEALDAIPLAAVSLKHRAVSVGKVDENGDYQYEIWKDVSDRKRVKVVNKTFTSRVAALEYMAANAQSILDTNTTFGEADLPAPDNINRKGVARRTEDVNGQDFMDTFGLRGVEFGNWNNQAERQEVMNAAYDGLMDLAEVLNVPSQAIGLNGDLALAFGARGAGLSGAKAHYEGDRSVINLTKMNGAGSLAHEWMHAFDHYLARLDGKTASEFTVQADGTKSFPVGDADNYMASTGFKRKDSGLRQEVRDAYQSVMKTIFQKAEQYVEDTQKADKFVSSSRDDLSRQLEKLRSELAAQKDPTYYKRNNKPASAEQLAEFDTIATQLINGEGLETSLIKIEGSRSATGSRWSNTALEGLSALYKAVRGRSGFNSTSQDGLMDSLRGTITRYDQRLKMLSSAQEGSEKIRNTPTDFAKDAREIDQGRGGDYWSLPYEMAARAFQGYVEDKIAALGARSPFLNYGPENSLIETPWGFKRPFPYGEERKAINAAFDNLTQTLETKQTDKGTALFSKSLSEPSDGRIVSADQESNKQSLQTLPGSVGSVTDDDGKSYQYKVVSTQKAGPVFQSIAQVLRVFGKKLVTFSSDELKADGFVSKQDGKTIFLNADSSVSPVEVASHELTHLLKADNPAVYAALSRLVRSKIKEGATDEFRKDYFGKLEDSKQGTDLSESEIDELISDLMGKQASNPSFFEEVFNEVASKSASGSRSAIVKFAATLNKTINALIKVIKQQSFKAESYVNDLEQVKSALKSALTQYAKDQKIPAMQMEAERIRAESGVDLTTATNNPIAMQENKASNSRTESIDNTQNDDEESNLTEFRAAFSSSRAAYDKFRERTRDGRAISDDDLFRFLSGQDGSKAARLGYVHHNGGRNPGLSTLAYRGEVAGQPAFYTSALTAKTDGTDAFYMYLFPLNELNDGSSKDIILSAQDGAYAWYLSAHKIDDSTWEVGTNAAVEGDKYFDLMVDSGEIIPIDDNYSKLVLPKGITVYDLMREGARRLTATLDGKTPSIQFARATGANPSDKVTTYTPDRVESKFSPSRQTETPEFKKWFGDWEFAKKAAILNGDPVASVQTSDAPVGGYKELENWAADVFSKQGGVAVRDGFGEVLLDRRAAKTSLAHGGANNSKKAAFAAIKDVIERGALVFSSKGNTEESFYFSAPVSINGVANIETVLVHRDPNTQRMYLHSVTTKENLLNQRVSRADTGASWRSGSTNSEGIPSILQTLLNFKPDSVSKVVDADGKPLVVYHGTDANDDFKSFDTMDFGSWFAEDEYTANGYTQKSGGNGSRIIPVYLNISNPVTIPKDVDLSDDMNIVDALNRVNEENQTTFEPSDFGFSDDYEGNAFELFASDAFIEYAKSVGFDGIHAYEGGYLTWNAFDATQIKSAIGNNGQFDSNNPDITASKQRIVGQGRDDYTPQHLKMFGNTGRTIEVPTIKDKVKEMRKDLGLKMAQGLADQFAPINNLSKEAYWLARLSKGSAGAIEAFLRHGKLKLTDNVYDADQSGGVIDRLGVPLQGELEDFMWWVASNRAERLMAQGKENLFSKEDIAAGKTLADGKTKFDYTIQHGPEKGKVTQDRQKIYRDSLITFNEFNKNALDMAEQSGLIDKESRKVWEDEFYVPFYRVSEEEGGFVGGKVGSALVRQKAFKALKGGSGKLNSDLLNNTLQNFAHLIDAAGKNRAAKASLEAAAQMGVAVEADEATARNMGKDARIKNQVVWYMDDGKEHFYVVEDPMVMAAITSLENASFGDITKVLGTFKHWLTVGVTASPIFKVRNLIRDSIQSIATSDLGYNALGNVYQGSGEVDLGGSVKNLGKTLVGMKADKLKLSDDYISALASGGLIRFGAMMDGTQSEHTRKLIKNGVQESTILDSDKKVKSFIDRFISPAIEAYNELGNRGEEINRVALYKQLKAQGKSHAEASFLARDLMDFSMQGSWSSIRILTQVVPFMNARIQGLYKLGRAGVENPRKVGVVLGATALASIGLMLAYGDDDDWKKREDWDRDNNWWFKIGGTAFRIPKPFEIGAIATLAERGLEYFIDPEMTGKRLGERTIDILKNQLSMNPTPQALKPIIDLYANKDSFTDRPIETMGMEKLEPQYRYTQSTTMAARGLSTATGGLLSPVQYDHVIRGYFGWLGSFVVGAADKIVRPMTNEAGRPAPDMWKVATQGMISSTEDASSRYVSQMYDQAKELEQAYGTYRMLMKTGRQEEAAQYMKDHKDELMKYKSVEHIKSMEAKLNERKRMIERSNLEPEQKRIKINEIRNQQDQMARMVAPGYR